MKECLDACRVAAMFERYAPLCRDASEMLARFSGSLVYWKECGDQNAVRILEAIYVVMPYLRDEAPAAESEGTPTPRDIGIGGRKKEGV